MKKHKSMHHNGRTDRQFYWYVTSSLSNKHEHSFVFNSCWLWPYCEDIWVSLTLGTASTPPSPPLNGVRSVSWLKTCAFSVISDDTGCSLNIVFFFRIIQNIPDSVFPQCQCAYTHKAGRTPALQQNWQSSEKSQKFKEKTQYLMNTLYITYLLSSTNFNNVVGCLFQWRGEIIIIEK